MISDVGIYKQAYADGHNAGWLQATLRAESRRDLGLPLEMTAIDDAELQRLSERPEGLTLDELATWRPYYRPAD